MMEGPLQVLKVFVEIFAVFILRSPACRETHKNLHHAKISRYTVYINDLVVTFHHAEWSLLRMTHHYK